MRIDMPPRKPKAEAIVPMINVVFLLLVFFLMTAQIAPPEPFQVLLPAAEQDTAVEGQVALYVNAEGLVGYQDLRGEAAITAAIAALAEGDADTPDPLLLRADAGVEAVSIAKLMTELSKAGARDVTLVTAAP